MQPPEPPLMISRPLVIGTAGHIDHGKSALVRALTGIDTDRLPEEKERGISIDLGFAHLEPRPGLILSFVDVPGHERFVKNMLAGATGIDAVLFVVAADEGLMPQSREHFDIVRLLGLDRILPVVTKCDLVDRETIDIVRLELDEYLGKALGRVPIVHEVSARTRVGLEELQSTLVQIAQQLPERSVVGAPRLSIDRRFVLQGHGTVITGTQVSGRFSVGDAIEILPSGVRARIRELQSHGTDVDSTTPGQRVAMKLHGVSTDEIERGDVISEPGALEAAYVFNARVELLRTSPIALEHRTRLRVHLGAAEVLARAEPLEAESLEPGAAGLIQLRLEKPAVAVGGQRFVLRRYSPSMTVGGGVVLEFPAPKSGVGGDPTTLQVLARLEEGGAEGIGMALALRSGNAGVPVARVRAELRRRGLTSGDESRVPGLTLLSGDILQRSSLYSSWRAEVLQTLTLYHREFPLEPGARPERIHAGSLAELDPAVLTLLLSTLEEKTDVIADQDRFRLPSFKPILDEASKGKLDRVVEELDQRGPLEEAEVLALLKPVGNKPPAVIQYLQDRGQVHRLDGGSIISRRHVARVLSLVAAELVSPGGLSVAHIREKTGWSRKYCIPFLELTDGLQLTRRRGDARTAGPALKSFLEPEATVG